jgi:two-component system, NtrC family, response regulator HydG
MHKILVVDDDNDMRLLLNRFLTRKNYDVTCIENGKATLEWMKKNKPDLVLCDFKLADMTGFQLMGKIKEIHPRAIIIIITGYADIKDAVNVMKHGAYDYITKPFLTDEILLTIKNALSEEPEGQIKIKPSVHYTKTVAPLSSTQNNQLISGNSPEFAEIIRQINLVAKTNFSVIIYGESGSGKEAIAQLIHQESKRANKPFIAIDCGALSKELANSELFGHEKGSFTGALTQKTGSLELANGGTIFLDEVYNLSYATQVSLLRVVQERKIRRIGGIKDIDIDVRIIVASNENLSKAARAGKFREDLYHRFNEFSIEVPSLRERRQDIMLFARHFLNLTNAELGKNIKGFTKEAEDMLNNYIWYGNLRELKNVIKRVTLLTNGDYVEVKSLPFEIIDFNKQQSGKPIVVIPEPQQIITNPHTHISYFLRPAGINPGIENDILASTKKYGSVSTIS